MACYHPIPAHQDRPGAPVRLWPPVGTATLDLPCGTCLGCRTDLATAWAHRAHLEASQWDHNCFVTLTYNEEHLPDGAHLRPKDLQKFFKRLRRGLDRQEPAIASTRHKGGLRYLASGEYGDQNLRPHFHILLFNCSFTDLRREAKELYSSPTLRKFWRLGEHRIGQLTAASANYVAQYSLKKLATPEGRHDENGEVYHPPFIRMSLKPPIGAHWLTKYKNDLQHGYLIHNARKTTIPRGIKKQLAKLDPALAEQAQQNALLNRRRDNDNRTQADRLKAAEAIHERRNALNHARPL